jgi:hypothetical protein
VTTRTRRLGLTAGLLALVFGISGLILVFAGHGRSAGGRAAATRSAPAAPAPGKSVPAVGGRRTITILGAGDVLLHPPLWAQAAADARAAGTSGYDFDQIFGAVRPDVSGADLALCHLETPLGPPSGPFSGYPTFSVPPQVASAIAYAGFDSCSTASNHSLDVGSAGIARTVAALDAAGVRHAGTYRSAAAERIPNIIDIRGVKVAQLSYSFGFNGLRRPPGKRWLAHLIDPAAIFAEARRARAAGAQIVVVSLHWGTEYDHHPNADQRRWARQLLADPAVDLILGCHAHVVQPFEQVNGKWVAYGMGNEIARHTDPIDSNREGVMPRFTLTELAPGRWQVTRAEAIPTWMDLSPAIRLVDLPSALADPATPAPARATYRAAYRRIAAHVLADGAPVRMVGGAA